VLADEALTLTEILRTKGFVTAGFVGTNSHFVAGNIAQGFDHFDEPELEAGQAYRQADRTIDAAISWLESREPEERVFVWIHLFDPHDPYHPPAEDVEAIFSLSEPERERLVSFLQDRHRVDPAFFGGPAPMLHHVNRYDAELHFADAELRRFHEYLGDSSLDANTAWIVTADHGEGLGNHRWLLHGKHIYNEQIRVPLIVYAPGSVLQAGRVSQLVETVDLLPTLLEWLDGSSFEPSPHWRGRSLMPLLHADGQPLAEKLAFAQRRSYDPANAPVLVTPESNYEAGETYAIQSSEFKLIHRTAGPDELFALTEDPYEERNLIDTGLEQEDALRARLTELIQALESGASIEPQPVDPEAMERLKSLGYVQ